MIAARYRVGDPPGSVADCPGGISIASAVSRIAELDGELVHGVRKVVQMSEVKPSHLAEDPV